MDEAKSLVHMFLTALFAVLILAAVLALITVGQLIWRAFSNQNDANRTMREYSKYSAFDGTKVRGQDVIALLHDTQGDPFVIVCQENYTPIASATNSVVADFKLHNYYSTHGGGAYINTIIQKTGQSEPSIASSAPTNFDYSTAATEPRYEQLQEFFLERGSLVSSDGSAGYLQYSSYLLYDGEDSADIAGVLLIEEGLGGTP